MGRGSGGEEEGGCLYVESEFCENSLAEICCVERDTETHKQRRAVGGGGGAIKLQNLVVKKKERYGRVPSSLFASFDFLMMMLFRGCNLRELGERKVVNWFVFFSEAWFKTMVSSSSSLLAGGPSLEIE